MSHAERLAEAAGRYGLDAVYAFGSRRAEISAFIRGTGAIDPSSASDVDIGILPRPGRLMEPDDRVGLADALERLFQVPRVDLVILPLASPFLALDVVSGDLLYCADRIREAEFQLFVLRRAGDLAYFERERRRQILSGISP